MSLRSELKTMQESLAITSPLPIARAEAFLSLPDRNTTLAQRRAVFENIPYSQREIGQMGTTREHIETIRVRFTAYDADFDRAIEIADAYKAVFCNALAYQRKATRRLNGTFDYVVMRDLDEPFEVFEGRPGWEMFLDFQIFATVVAP